jgi:ubiquinone/menaquinone biosynthesis C-methylase UbiE
MGSSDAVFAGSIPAIYEEYLVPLLFEPYAEDLARRVADLRSGVVLEIAAGTGAVTRALLKALPPTVKIVATDLNEAMLRLGEAHASGASVSWQQADAQKLPFDDASVDAVVCQFGVMFMPDKVLAFREALRVLRSGGRYIFNVWGALDQNEVSDVVTRSVAALFPNDPPRFFERTPFGYYDHEVIQQALHEAGFGNVEIEVVNKVTRAPSAAHVAFGLCKGTPLRGEIEARAPTGLDEITGVATDALAACFGSADFDNRMRAHVVTAYRS